MSLLLVATTLLHNTKRCLSIGFVCCFYFLYSLEIDAYNSTMAIFRPASWLPLYNLASTWLQLVAPIAGLRHSTSL